MKPTVWRKGLSRYRPEVVERWLTRFILVTGGLLTFTGVAHLLAFIGRSQTMDISDPLFGVSFRYIGLFIGLSELLVGVACLFTTRKENYLLSIIAWMSANVLIYRIGMLTLGWFHPCDLVNHLTDVLNISPRTADFVSITVSIFLFAGSLILSHSGTNRDYLKISCHACGGRIRFAPKNLGQLTVCPHCATNIALRKPEETLKMSCFFCREHIAFPPHALGQKTVCPHCKMDITLKERL